jgi:acyl carrier protein
MEALLAEIWADLLRVEKVGVRDNFFELGGHSLLATRVISAIRRKLTIDIPVNLFFRLVTIESTAKYIQLNRQDSLSGSADIETIKL